MAWRCPISTRQQSYIELFAMIFYSLVLQYSDLHGPGLYFFCAIHVWGIWVTKRTDNIITMLYHIKTTSRRRHNNDVIITLWAWKEHTFVKMKNTITCSVIKLLLVQFECVFCDHLVMVGIHRLWYMCEYGSRLRYTAVIAQWCPTVYRDQSRYARNQW